MSHIDLAQAFFKELEEKPQWKRFLKYPYLPDMNIRIQFDVKDGEPFWMRIQDGKFVEFQKGKLDLKTMDPLSMVLEVDAETLKAIFERRITFGTAMYYGKLWMPGMFGRRNLSIAIGRMFKIGQETLDEALM